MKLLILALTLVSSTALASRPPTLVEKSLREGLTRHAVSKIQSILNRVGVSYNRSELDDFVKQQLIEDIRNGDKDMSMVFLPKNAISEDLNLDEVPILYGLSEELRPEGLHSYLVNDLKNENEFTDANVFLLAQYNTSYLAMYEIEIANGEIALGSAAYYEINTVKGEGVAHVQETALLNVLMEDTKGITKDGFTDKAFERLFDYHKQWMPLDKLKELAAALARSFFSHSHDLQMAGGSAANGNGTGAAEIPALGDFNAAVEEWGNPSEQAVSTIGGELETLGGAEAKGVLEEVQIPEVEVQEVELTFAEFLKKKVDGAGITNKVALSKDLEIYESAIRRFTAEEEPRLPSYEIMIKMLENGLATKLALSDTELDELVEAWESAREAKLTDEQQTVLTELVNSIKGDMSGTGRQMTATEPQKPKSNFALALGEKVNASDLKRRELSEMIGKSESYIHYSITGGHVAKYETMQMLIGGLAAPLRLSETDVDELVDLWKSETDKEFDEAELNAFVAEVKEKIAQAAEAQEVEGQVDTVPAAEVQVEEAQTAKDKFVSFFTQMLKDKNIAPWWLSTKVLEKEGSSHFSHIIRDGSIPRYGTMMKMLKGGEGLESLAIVLELSAEELDVFVDLWREAREKASKTGITGAQKKQIDRLVADIKSKLPATEPQATGEGQVHEVQVAEPQTTEAMQATEPQEVEEQIEVGQELEIDNEVLAKLYAELQRKDLTEEERAEIELEILDLKAALMLVADVETKATESSRQREENRKAYSEAKQQLLAAMSAERVKWADIETYALNAETSITHIEGIVAKLGRSLKNPDAILEKATGLAKGQLSRYLAGETVLTKDEYGELCDQLAGICVGDEVERMLDIERVLVVHEQNLSELDTADYVSDESHRDTLKHAYELWKQAQQQQ